MRELAFYKDVTRLMFEKVVFLKQKMTIKIAAVLPSLVFLLTLTLMTVSPSLLQAAVFTVRWDVSRHVGRVVRQIIACEYP